MDGVLTVKVAAACEWMRRSVTGRPEPLGIVRLASAAQAARLPALTDAPVYSRAPQVGVAMVAGVLLGHVNQKLTQSDRRAGPSCPTKPGSVSRASCAAKVISSRGTGFIDDRRIGHGVVEVAVRLCVRLWSGPPRCWCSLVRRPMWLEPRSWKLGNWMTGGPTGLGQVAAARDELGDRAYEQLVAEGPSYRAILQGRVRLNTGRGRR
jgi:hypothetical protein